MIFDTDTAYAPAPPKRCNLLLHCGSDTVTRERLVNVPTPAPTRTWRPIPHHRLLGMTLEVLQDENLKIVGEAHGLSHDGQRYFGLLEVAPTAYETEAHRVIGLRNSHDKRLSAGLVAGSQVLVCDNLCFAGEIALARKHTTRILRDLPNNLAIAVSRLRAFWNEHEQRMRLYADTGICESHAHHLMIRAVDEGVLAISSLLKVLRHWREPEHEAFQPRTVWSLQNAFTEALKGSLDRLPERTMRLHRLFDSYCNEA